MNRKELEKLYLKNSDGVFPPKYTYKEIETSNGKDFIYTITQSADEVYQEYLENKDKPIEKEPTEQEKLNAQLLKSNLEFQKMLTEQKKVNANLLLQIQALQKKEGNE